MTPKQAIRRFITTGEHDMLHGAWPGGNIVEQMHKGDNSLRAALIEEVRRRTTNQALPSLPPGFDADGFVLDKVTPMVRGLFPAKERPAILALFENALVFMTQDNIEQVITEAPWLSTAWKVANLYLGSLDLPGLDEAPVGFVGFSEETTFYLSTAYFEDKDPYADWVVHEAAHVFHNWKRDRTGLPHTRNREFLLEIAYSKREVFAYGCEAYARIQERAKGSADRRRLHADYAEHWAPKYAGLDQAELHELIDILAEAVKARNGWKRILQRCANGPRKP